MDRYADYEMSELQVKATTKYATTTLTNILSILNH